MLHVTVMQVSNSHLTVAISLLCCMFTVFIQKFCTCAPCLSTKRQFFNLPFFPFLPFSLLCRLHYTQVCSIATDWYIRIYQQKKHCNISYTKNGTFSPFYYDLWSSEHSSGWLVNLNTCSTDGLSKSRCVGCHFFFLLNRNTPNSAAYLHGANP